MSQSSANDAGLQRLLALAKREAEAPIDPIQHRLGRARLIERAVRRQQGELRDAEWRTRWVKPIWVLAAAAMVIGLFWGLRSRPVTFVVRDAPAAPSYVRATEEHPVDVEFSDGTRIHADVGARFRIEERTRNGARIAIESGRSTANVVHANGTDWRFVAGPFEVLVTGTRFWIDWEPMSEQLDLRLEEGSVDVTGPLSPSRVTVRAGQHLHASVIQRSLTVFDGAPLPPMASPSASMQSGVNIAEPNIDPEVGAGDSAAALPLASAMVPASPPTLSWSKLLRQGKFEAIVRLAESPSRPSCTVTCSATDLLVLAEAARYVGRSDLAESTLLALRKRFPDHPESQKAAFLLARLYESRADRGRAEGWYRTYLAESPAGALAADALAGQMRVVRRARGAKAAEPLAREYLGRYPDGVHAAAAQQILREEP